jgi:thiol:disulfide interchange protein DsbD
MTRPFLQFFTFLIFILFASGLCAQQASVLKETPTWKITVSKSPVKAGDEVEITFVSQIEKNWYMYSNDFDPNLGPVVADFKFDKHPSYQLTGKLRPVGAKKHYEEVWGGDVSIFTGKAEFRQKVKILKANPVIKGTMEFMECSQITGVCMPPFDQEFKVSFGNSPAPEKKKVPVEIKEEVIAEQIPVVTDSFAVDTGSSITGTSGAPCEKVNMTVPNESYIKNDASEDAVDGSDTQSIFSFMVYAFLFGLGAIFTPCVFPMIPMTVTFFTKNKDHGRLKAMFFGLCIILIYTVVGTLVAIFMGPDFANWLSTAWIPNILFFLIFLIFGFSFLGMFEITLPSRFVNSIDQKSGMGSLGGIFFMAFTMVLVSFSCTGPLVGNVLIQAFGGNYLRPIAGMFSFSLAFAIPFTLFAIFPQWLSTLPKSGGWLNSVKVVLGFLELALALKFLSIADTVYHWGLLNRDVYLVIWIVLFGLMGLYLIGKIRFVHDSPMEHIGVVRLLFAIVAFSFTIYLIPGLIGSPLKAISGYLPPQHTLAFDLYTSTQKKNLAEGEVKYSKLLHLPHNLSGFYDYCQALEYSRKVGKPVFIDFTGHGCVNCREMEANVWSNPEVLKRLQEDYVVVALYADERFELPESDWYTSPYDGKVKKTVGKQVSDLQVRKFNFNAQPLYVLIDADENLLAVSKSYDLNVQNFINFLDKGKSTYGLIHQP